MMKKIVFLALIFSIFLTISKPAFSEDRYATCDLCGYCQGPNITPPADWEKCRDCLYPGITSEATSNETLKIDSATNKPITPKPGHAYTTLGCVTTNLGSFESKGAASSLVQILLNFIFSIIGALSFIYLIYGAFFIATSQGNMEKLNQGKKIIVGAVIGLLFSLSAVLIIKIIATQILKTPSL